MPDTAVPTNGGSTVHDLLALSDEQILGSKPLVAVRIAMQQARTSLLNAEQKLRNFRFDDAALALILKTNDTRPLLDITTPIDGTVIFRHAVTGEAEEPTSKLYTVADISKLWLWVDIFERDIRQVRAAAAHPLCALGCRRPDRGVHAGMSGGHQVMNRPARRFRLLFRRGRRRELLSGAAQLPSRRRAGRGIE